MKDKTIAMIEPRSPVSDTENSPMLASSKQAPVTLGGRIRRLIFGNPISSEHMEHTLLSKIVALPVFASDAISSVAYATQEIILALGAVGLYADHMKSQYQNYTMLVSSLIVLLLVIVVISYWQTIFGYPSGGGSYIVSKDNLGVFWGLIAAAALLIDYVLTVAVSIASGVQNLAGIPLLQHYHPEQHMVPICLLFVALLTLANLRGLKESGTLFAIPTYMFVLMCYVMIGIGFLAPLFGWRPHLEHVAQWQGAQKAGEAFGLFVLLRAFANGCSAMTGTEAVSNGIPAFQEPKSRNAALTLVAMGVILGTIFIGVSALAMKFHVVYWEGTSVTAPAVIDQISSTIFGNDFKKEGPLVLGYYVTQFFTAAILILAANTSFADFPRLSSILARDHFLPKQLSNLGDRLIFANGIFLLGASAAILIWVKKGNVDALIPLYAVGVFAAFTLSQAGMVKHWHKLRVPGWRVKAIINGVGACATFLVLIDIAAEKFKEGAWIVIILAALLVLMFRKIYSHYADVAQQLKMANYHAAEAPLRNTVLVLMSSLHRGVMPAIEYGRTLSGDVRCVHIETDPAQTPQLKERWEKWVPDMPLVILNSPYRSFIKPLMQYLNAVQVERRNHLVTVVVPEFVSTKWWHSLLHGNTGLRLKIALLGRSDVIVANVRYFLQDLGAPPRDALSEEDADGPGASSHGHGDKSAPKNTDAPASQNSALAPGTPQAASTPGEPEH